MIRDNGHEPECSSQGWNSNIIWLLLRERLVLGHTGRMMLWQIFLVLNAPGWLVRWRDTGLWLADGWAPGDHIWWQGPGVKDGLQWTRICPDLTPGNWPPDTVQGTVHLYCNVQYVTVTSSSSFVPGNLVKNADAGCFCEPPCPVSCRPGTRLISSRRSSTLFTAYLWVRSC